MPVRPISVDPEVYKRDKIPTMIVARIRKAIEEDPLREDFGGKAKKIRQTECTVEKVRYIVFLKNLADCDSITEIKRAHLQH